MRQAFSLVELSIVLVILGLLVGGILTGQSLIRAAELRSVSTELQTYHSAVMTFKDKYFALPGDMTNATDFWDAAHSTPATCATTVGTGTQTCNGDGDGRISVGTGTDASVYERYRFWQHLANAGLIEGSYTGVGTGTDNNIPVLGQNVPASKLSNGSYTAVSPDEPDSSHSRFPGVWHNMYVFGGENASGTWNNTAVLTPEEAWNVDKKIDDGKPGYGRLTTFRNGYGASPNCSTTDTASTSEYALSTTSIECILIWNWGQ